MNDISKGAYKDIGDAIGMPDATDKKNIRALIDSFEKKNPGMIKEVRDEARIRLAEMGRSDAVVDKLSGRRYALEIPEPLHQAIENYIPTIFRSKRHFQWLRTNFKELFVEY